jgi:lysophospholipase L1-like esterase
MRIEGESMVLAGRTEGQLCFDNIAPGTIVVRSTYQPNQPDTTVYEQGRDYVVNYQKGTIARAPLSRIPDFSKNMLYGEKNFNHIQYPGYGNTAFLVWVDYQTRNGRPFAIRTDQSDKLVGTAKKLHAGGPFKIIAFGDSITAGGEASTESLRFPNLYAASLQKRFPQAQITMENGATGGDTSAMGLSRIEEKVLTRKPDLVLLAFGMNDHNIAGYGVPPDAFQLNLCTMIDSIRSRTGSEVIVISAFPPNPDWMFGSHQMDNYAAATKQAAITKKCAYADVYSIWMKLLERKDCSSLLGNNINHPTNFGHWIYLQALEAVGFQQE